MNHHDERKIFAVKETKAEAKSIAIDLRQRGNTNIRVIPRTVRAAGTSVVVFVVVYGWPARNAAALGLKNADESDGKSSNKPLNA